MLAKTFTVPVIGFNKRLACLNDHCLKMASYGWLKGTVSKYTQKNAILNYFQQQNTISEAKEVARSILNNVLNNSLTDSTDYYLWFCKWIWNSKQCTETDHFGSRLNKSTFEKWTEKFPLLIVINIKEQTTPSCKICQDQRDILKF